MDVMSMVGGKVKVVKGFPAGFFDGLTLPGMVMGPGDELVVQPTESEEWPAFALVVRGEERGWVPKRYLSRREGKATATRTYDTTTLNPSEGEILTVIEEDMESGWLWCRDARGGLGWFALDHVAPFPK